ncbi:class I SAM-dependent methyltransferase [Phytomonospora sp. NPDC050363]|uniref:class I SAM-dependent methyltransferase n=1 Tax=Phytomonospora sp. NPDC050363 TaxID=3155642 RepID=UPI0033BFBCCA
MSGTPPVRGLGDVVERFYDRHPYPPPAKDLEAVAARTGARLERRSAHHLVWPERPYGAPQRVLIAGCGTSQAARHALLRPDDEVVGIDVSSTGIEHTRRLADRHGSTNLTLHRLAVEDVAELGETFDHVVCTGVLHHLADPLTGLRSLRSVLAPGGAVTLMVYAPYGRAGVYLIQDYCRRLGVTTSGDDLADLVATLREIPGAHPLSRLLRESRDFLDDDALADALLNPRDRAYTVGELLELIAAAGLRFGRWARQAPYLPDCGSISETPHAARIAALPVAEQHAALELFRGTLARHTVIAYDEADETSGRVDFADPAAERWRPIRVPTAIAIEERLPPGAAAALLNRAHGETDLVTFVTEAELAMFRRVDGSRTVGELGPDARPFAERLYRHDLVVIDASGATP